MKRTAPAELPPSPQVTTRTLRARLAHHLASHSTTLILKRNTPIALLLPLYLNRWPTISDLKKSRTHTLRRVRRIFDQLETDHAR